MRSYRIYLHDIIDAMENIEIFTQGMSFEEFCADAKTFQRCTGQADSHR